MNLQEIKEQLMFLKLKKPNWEHIDWLTVTEKAQFIEEIINIYPEHKNDFSHEEKKILIVLLRKLDVDIHDTLEKSPEKVAQKTKITELLSELQRDILNNPAFQRYQEDQAARKIQTFVRKNVGTTAQRMNWQLSAVRKHRQQSNKQDTSTTLYPSDVFARFQHRGYLGGGGFGNVYTVFDKRDDQTKAYKNARAKKDEVRVVVTEALDKGYTPHLTQIFEIIRLRDAYGCYALSAVLMRDENYMLQEDAIPREVLLANIILHAPEYEHLVTRTLGRKLPKHYRPSSGSGLAVRGITLMEKLDGDMSGKKLSLADEVQLASTWVIMQQMFNTSIGDHKDKNIFYKTLTDTDIFHGKKLIDYDYWLYKIGNDEFYIPRPQYLLKLGDYDDWEVYAPPKQPTTDTEILTKYLGETTLQEARRKFTKPVGIDDSKILDMSPPSMYEAKAKMQPADTKSESAYPHPDKRDPQKFSSIGIETTTLKLIEEFEKSAEPTDTLIKKLIRHNVSLDCKNKISGKTLFECILSHPKITAEDIVFVFMYHPHLKIDQAELALAACHLNDKSFQVLFDHINEVTIKFDWLGILERAALNLDSVGVMRVILKVHSQEIMDALKNETELSSGYVLVGQLSSDNPEQREKIRKHIQLLKECNINPKDIARKLDSRQEESQKHYLRELEKITTLSDAECHEINEIIKPRKSSFDFFKSDKRNDFLEALKVHIESKDRLAMLDLIQETELKNPAQKKDKIFLETEKIISQINAILKNKPGLGHTA